MKKTLELAWGVIRRPTPTFRRIKEEKPLGRGIFIAFLPLFIMFYISIFREIGLEIGGREVLIVVIPFTYLVILSYTALLNFTARLLKSKNEYKNLLISNFFIFGVIGSIKCLVVTGLSLSKYPLTATVCSPAGCHAVKSLSPQSILITLLFAFWMFFLLILALKEIYKFSASNAMTIFGLTFLLILLLFIVTIPNLYSTSLPICIVILALLICVILILIFKKVLSKETFRRKTFYFFAIFGALLIVLLRVEILNGVVIPGNIQARYCVYPQKIITGSRGNIYVTSIGFGGIYKFDPEGKFLGRFESDYPNKIASGSEGIIYIAGWGYKKGCKIQKLTEDGKPIETILLKPPFPISTGYIKDMNVDSQGNIYLLISHSQRIPKKTEYKVQKFSPEGKFLMEFGEEGKGDKQFYLPWSIAIDEKGNIYVTGMYRFQKFDNKGRFVKIFKSTKERDPEYCGISSWNIEVDKEGNIYTLSQYLKKELKEEIKVWKLKKFNRQGKPIMTIEITGNGYEKFWHPAGMAIGKNAYIYLADPYNHRIQVFNNQGKFLKNIKHNPFMIKWYEESLIGRLLESISYHKPFFRRAKK